MPISVIDPFRPALQRTGQVLFQPFRLRKWLAISVGAWLWLMGEQGLSPPNFSYSTRGGGPGGRGVPPPDVAKILQDALDWIRANLYWLIPVAIGVLVIGTAFYLVWRWLSSRGTFMFFDNIVNNDARVKAPWADFRAQGNSLFKFMISWDLLWLNAWLVVLVIAGFLEWKDFEAFVVNNQYTVTASTISAIVVAVLGFLGIALAHWVLGGIVFRLAVPTMFIRGLKAWPAVKVAWRELFLPNMGVCLLYFLFLIAVGAVRAAWGAIAVLLMAMFTCCTALCIIYIPLVGTLAILYPMALLSLPVLTFDRAYTLHFMTQFGPAYYIPWQMTPVGGFPVIMDQEPPPGSASA